MEKKIKVTQISKYYPPFCGGIEDVAKQISDSIISEDCNVEVIACADSKKNLEDIIDNVKVQRCGVITEFKANPISIDLIKALSKVKTDVLHYHHPFIFAVIAHYIARPKYKKLTITYHSDIVGYNNIMKYFNGIYTKFLDSVDKIHVLSPNIIENSNVLKKYRNKCEVIPYSINLADFEKFNHDKVNTIRNTYPNKKILLFIGRLIHYKGISYLIEAMNNVPDDVVLLIGGTGPLKNELERKVVENNLSSKVIFEGRISEEDLISYYQACDLFVFPSILPSEAFGISQLEAMACGKPIINTNLGTGVNFVSINEETGITVSPADKNQLSNAINSLINDNVKLEIYALASKQRVINFFNIKNTSVLYKNFFQIY